jgi:hypothetical protein
VQPTRSGAAQVSYIPLSVNDLGGTNLPPVFRLTLMSEIVLNDRDQKRVAGHGH